MRLSYFILLVLFFMAGSSWLLQSGFVPQNLISNSSPIKSLELLTEPQPVVEHSKNSTQAIIEQPTVSTQPIVELTESSPQPVIEQTRTSPQSAIEHTETSPEPVIVQLETLPQPAIEIEPSKTLSQPAFEPQKTVSQPVVEYAASASRSVAEHRDTSRQIKQTSELPAVTTNSELQKQAESFVAEIAAPAPAAISVLEADHFVGREQILKLIPQLANKTQTQETEAKQPAAIVNALPDFGDLVVTEYIPDTHEDNLIIREPVVIAEPNAPEKMVLSQSSASINTTLEIQSEIKALIQTQTETQTVTDTKTETETETETEIEIEIEIEINEIQLEELLDSSSNSEDAIYYVRTVSSSDHDGIWGIIVDGITQNFAQGIAVRQGETLENYQVDIPKRADSLNPDSSSSFLGRLVYRKSIESHVYNFRNQRMGKNPDLIYPGQELVIVNFQPVELAAIYAHFVENAR